MMQLDGLRKGFAPTRLGPIHHVSAGQGPAPFLIHGMAAALAGKPAGTARASWKTISARRGSRRRSWLLFPLARCCWSIRPVSPDFLAIQGRVSQAAREHSLRQGMDINPMLCQPQHVDEQALALLEFCVRHTRVVSRHLSRSTSLIPMLAELPMPVQVLLDKNDPHCARRSGADRHPLAHQEHARPGMVARKWSHRPPSTRRFWPVT